MEKWGERRPANYVGGQSDSWYNTGRIWQNGDDNDFKTKRMNEQQMGTVEAGGATAPRWKPVGRVDRRVVGVLVEKSKTTPDQYPMTINGLINGANQKSNRDPQMELEESDIIDSLDRLKMVGAVIEVQGSGRVPKYRHLLYEWLGVNKVELAVMAELLLRGRRPRGSCADGLRAWSRLPI